MLIHQPTAVPHGKCRGTATAAAAVGPAKADGSLDAAMEAVSGACFADEVLAPQTLDKFGLLNRRFARFAAAHDVTTFAGVDRALVSKFVAAKGRTRHGVVSDAAVATVSLSTTVEMHRRLTRIAGLL